VKIVLETSNSSPTSPLPLMPARRSADETDDDDDVMAGARSCSPSSDVENILEALRDTTTVYFGDFTLRRVFSLEEELVNDGASGNDARGSAGQEVNPRTAAATQTDRGGHENDRQSAQTMWTLPLARRLTPAATIGKTLTRVFRRFNGISQERRSMDDADCFRAADNPVVSASATAMLHDPDCPADMVDYLSVTPPSADIVQSISVTDEEDRAVRKQERPVETLCAEEARRDASVITCVDPVSADVGIQRCVEQRQNGCVAGQSKQTLSATTTSGYASLNVHGVQKPEFELCGIPKSENLSVANTTDGFRQTKDHVTPRLKPVRRCSSNRDASRPPIQPRTSSPSGGHGRRSATPSRASVDCLLPGLTTVGVSRTSSCEVLVDEDDSRLTDVIIRHSGVTRRSSCTSSVADDAESTAASETDSSAACFDVDDLVANSLLDRLLMRLRSPPRDSPSSCGRRPSTRTSVSSSSDEEIDPLSGVDVTTERALPQHITRKHCSFLSSLDDISSDSDFELGSSLSQLMMEKFARHPSTTHSTDRLSSSAACIADVARVTQNHRNWMENSTYVPPRPAAVDMGTSLNGQLVNSAVTELSAPISQSQPAQIHIARTSRIPKY